MHFCGQLLARILTKVSVPKPSLNISINIAVLRNTSIYDTADGLATSLDRVVGGQLGDILQSPMEDGGRAVL